MPPFGHGHGLGFGGVAGPAAPAWVPTDLAGLTLWLPVDIDATAMAQTSGGGGVVADGDPIGRIEDQSALSIPFLQGTSTQRPLYEADAFATGKPGALFDGTDDSWTDTLNPISPIRTLGLSYKLDATSGAGVYQCLCHLYQSDGHRLIVYVCNAGGYTTLSISNNSATAAGVGVAGICNDTSSHTIVVTYNGGTRTDPASYGVRLDGVAQTVASSGTHAPGTATSAFGRYPGGVFPLNGRLAAAVATTDVLTGTDLSNLESYLNGRRT